MLLHERCVDIIQEDKCGFVAGRDICGQNTTHPGLVVHKSRITKRGCGKLNCPEHTNKQVAPHSTDHIGQVGSGALGSHLADLRALDNREACKRSNRTVLCLTNEVEQESTLLIALANGVGPKLVVLVERLRPHNECLKF